MEPLGEGASSTVRACKSILAAAVVATFRLSMEIPLCIRQVYKGYFAREKGFVAVKRINCLERVLLIFFCL